MGKDDAMVTTSFSYFSFYFWYGFYFKSSAQVGV